MALAGTLISLFWAIILTILVVRYFRVSAEDKRKVLGLALSTTGALLVSTVRFLFPPRAGTSGTLGCLTLLVAFSLMAAGGYLIFTKGNPREGSD